MIELRQHARFAFKTLQKVSSFTRTRPEDFDRHLAPQIDIFREKDGRHTTIADLFHNAVMTQHLTDQTLGLLHALVTLPCSQVLIALVHKRCIRHFLDHSMYCPYGKGGRKNEKLFCSG